MAWVVECWSCGGEGVHGHDCGEDCCCCLDPEENVECDICEGRGSWVSEAKPDDPDIHCWLEE